MHYIPIDFFYQPRCFTLKILLVADCIQLAFSDANLLRSQYLDVSKSVIAGRIAVERNRMIQWN